MTSDLLLEFSFEARFQIYKTNPSSPIIMPQDPEIEEIFWTDAKNSILKARHKGDVVDAKRRVEFAWVIVKQTQKADHIAMAHWCEGTLLFNRDVRQTLAHLKKALSHYHQTGQTEKEGRVLIGCGSQLTLLGKLAEAEEALEQAIHYLQVTPNYPGWPALYLNLSQLKGRQGHYLAMLDNARQTEALAHRFEKDNPTEKERYQRLRAQGLINQAFAAIVLGRLSLAKETLLRAQALADVCQSAEIAGQAKLNLARLSIYKGHLFEALHILDAAKQDFKRAKIDIDQATVAIEEASLYQQLMMPQEARKAAHEAAEAFKKEKIIAEAVEAYLLTTRLSLALLEPNRAKRYLEQIEAWLPQSPPILQALWQGYTAHPLFQRNKAQRHQALASVEQVTQHLKSLGAINEYLEMALLEANLAASLKQTGFKQRYQNIIAAAKQYHLPALEQNAYLALSTHLRPKNACIPLQKAVNLSSQSRRAMPIEELKANLLTGSRAVYTRLIEAQLKSKQPHLALQTLFEAKGGLWADLAATPPQTPLPTQWLQAKTKLDFWRTEAREDNEAPYQNLCDDEVAAAEATLIQIARHQTRYRPPQDLPTLADIQAHLGADAVLISYLLGSKQLYACIIKPDGPPQWQTLGPIVEIKSLMRKLSLRLADLQSTPLEHRLRASVAQHHLIIPLLSNLYHHLLAPLEAFITPAHHLILAPDTFLFDLPWAALHTDKGYLGQNYALSFVPAASLWSKAGNTSQDSVAVGTPLFLGYSGQPPLHYLAQEQAAIQQSIAGVRCINPACYDDLKWAEPPRLLHLATHGYFHPTSPLLSALTLADGDFLLADAFALNLTGTQLVTLSACATATTPEQGGILLALAGAFLSAGSQTVIASLWPVDDQATQLLMSTFYTHLQQGISLPQALHHAQNALRQQGYSHPFYWAAFQPLSRVAVT